MKLKTLFTVFLITLNFLLPSKTSAQSAGLAISPPTIEILLAPTKKVTQAFTVKNQGATGQFVASLHHFTPNGTSGQALVDPKPLDPSSLPLVVTLASPSLHFDEPFTIGQGASLQLVLTVEGATTDTTEDAYLALVIQPVSTNSSLPSTIPGIASLLLVTLTPTSVLPVDLSIENFELPLIFDTSSTLSLSPSLKNNTAIMIRPQGSLEIISPRGRHNQTISLYPNLVLGKSSRKIMAQCGTEACPVSFQPSWYHLGPYRFRLTITTQGGTRLSEVERTIWLLPLKAGTIILVLATLILAINLYRRRAHEVS